MQITEIAAQILARAEQPRRDRGAEHHQRLDAGLSAPDQLLRDDRAGAAQRPARPARHAPARRADFTAGQLTETGSPTDLAIARPGLLRRPRRRGRLLHPPGPVPARRRRPAGRRAQGLVAADRRRRRRDRRRRAVRRSPPTASSPATASRSRASLWSISTTGRARPRRRRRLFRRRGRAAAGRRAVAPAGHARKLKRQHGG